MSAPALRSGGQAPGQVTTAVLRGNRQKIAQSVCVCVWCICLHITSRNASGSQDLKKKKKNVLPVFQKTSVEGVGSLNAPPHRNLWPETPAASSRGERSQMF